MNYFLKHTLRTATMVTAGLLIFSSCNDSWDDHYDTAPSLNYAGTTWEYIQGESTLSDFAEVAKAAGYDTVIASPQVFTILAPQNGSFNKDSLLNLISSGQKSNVITRFLENHIMRYNYSLGTTSKTATLLNDKNVEFGTLSNPVVQNSTVLQTNISCKDGVLQIIDSPLLYYPNLFEQLQSDYADYLSAGGSDTALSLYSFLRVYDDDELDEERSVASGIDESGNTVYIDSVMNRRNTVLQNLDAYLYREDSNYVMLIPSQEAFQARVEENVPLFKFNSKIDPSQEALDSMQNYYARYYAISDLFYNWNINEQHSADSVYSTSYSRSNWEYNRFYDPYQSGGIFSNVTEKEQCSNGQAWYVTEYPFSNFQTFNQVLKLEGEVNDINTEENNSWTDQYATTLVVSNTSDSVSGSGYLSVSSSLSSRSRIDIAFNLPKYYSTTYDIYVRFLPQSVSSSFNPQTDYLVPVRFQAYLFERQDNGTMPKRSTYTFSPQSGENYFFTNPACVDNVYLGRYTFSNCYRETSETGALLQLRSSASSTQENNHVYTKNMLIDRIVMIPVQEASDESATGSSAKHHF